MEALGRRVQRRLVPRPVPLPPEMAGPLEEVAYLPGGRRRRSWMAGCSGLLVVTAVVLVLLRRVIPVVPARLHAGAGLQVHVDGATRTGRKDSEISTAPVNS